MDHSEQRLAGTRLDRLLNWFQENQRNLPWRMENRSPYTIWVSEVMLQQTRVDTVIPYYERFMEAYPTVEDLARASEEEVLNLWEGLGFYARARNLHEAAGIIVQKYDGIFPQTKDKLKELPGIGPSTAAAILSFAFQKQVPYLDGNVFRVISRFTGYMENTETAEGTTFIRSIVEESMPDDQPGQFNEALIELGATVCTPSAPDCDHCPLASDCVAYRKEIQEDLPYRGETREVPTRTRTALFVRCGPDVLLTRRPSQGLLGGMWELPALWNQDDESLLETAQRTREWALGTSGEVQPAGETVIHKYSHFHLNMPLYELHVDERKTGGELWESGWFSPRDLDEVPLHRAAQKALEQFQYVSPDAD